MENVVTSANELSTDIESIAANIGFALRQSGSGRPVLFLHGGGGPATIAAFAAGLSSFYHVMTPIHPGFDLTPRPAQIATVKDLASAYLLFIERAGLSNVLVIGSSIGGWIAAEMATANPAAVSGFILLDAVGIKVPGQEILDVFSIPPGDIANYGFHAPDRFRINPADLSEQQKAVAQSNLAVVAIYSGPDNMQDATLHQRLAGAKAPVLVIWGESDRIAYPDYGRAYAKAFSNGRFELIGECGHLPQIEQPQRLLELVRGFEQAN